MKAKKIAAVMLAATMTLSLAACGGSSSSDSKSADGASDSGKVYKIGICQQLEHEALDQATKGFEDACEEKFGKDKLEIKYLESKQDADYVQNIDTFADEGMDLIVGVGFKLQSAITEAAKNYPEQQFALIDAVCEGEQPENVTSLLFEDNASAYLTGLIAGRMTETNKVGFIGGMESPVISKFDYGFRAGVKAANPDAEVMVQYANSFTDSALGKTIANQMHSKNADIIFTCAGAVGIGAIEAAKENGKKAIGVDQDQNALAPKNVITSAMKNIDVAVVELLSKVVDGSYKGGEVIINTLAMNGVGIPQSSEKNVPPDVLKYVIEEAEKVKSGEVKVPATKEEFEQLNK